LSEVERGLPDRSREDQSATGIPKSPGMIRVSIGPIDIVTGDGECFQAVGAYLKSLAN
jgi:hypothetical protein